MGSADSVVPGTASGSLQGMALKPLTVDFHEVGFGATLNSENGQLFWFQLSDDDKQKVGNPWGPANPQSLNRYSYVLNTPVRWTDPSGHSVYMTKQEAIAYVKELRQLAKDLINLSHKIEFVSGGVAVIGGVASLAEKALLKSLGLVGAVIGAIGWALGKALPVWADEVTAYADKIEELNKGESGVIISVDTANQVTVISRDTGNGYTWRMAPGPAILLFVGSSRVTTGMGRLNSPSVWESGHACTISGGNPVSGNYYSRDHALCKRR